MNTLNDNRVGRVLRVRNVNEALPQALRMLNESGVHAESRAMKTVRLPGPFLTVYTEPRERVLFDPTRNANPFFHMIDALWLLSGSMRADLPRMFLPRIMDFSDDGETFHGAYGYRLRAWPVDGGFFDQIEDAVRVLQEKPDSRQVVLSIWDPRRDLGAMTKDMPCNDMIMLDIVDERLCMTVCNRSNDAIWGAYGANVVQFSMLQEYMAARIGVGVGHYVQMSNNFHVYEDNPYWTAFREGKTATHNPYKFGVKTHPMALSSGEAEAVYADCRALASRAEAGLDLCGTYSSPFFERVVGPMLVAHRLYKQGRVGDALQFTGDIQATDWSIACTRWLERRL